MTQELQSPHAQDGLKRAVQEFWDSKPCGTQNSPSQPGSPQFFQEVESHRYEEEFHIPEVAEFADHRGERVLEVGCGLGTDGCQFAQGGAIYLGCDLSQRSLSLAREAFRHRRLPGDFASVDAETLPFAASSFDLVYSHGVLHHTPDTPAAIREVHRVLRPGGRAIIMLYARTTFWIGAQTLGRLRLRRLRQRLGREEFNRMMRLPREFEGWLPTSLVISNSTDGVGNPLSQIYNRRELAQLFAPFKSIRLEKHYFPRRKLPWIGERLPRSFSYWLGRAFGAFWYIKADK